MNELLGRQLLERHSGLETEWQLDPSQLAALNSNADVVTVLGSAGTGKTLLAAQIAATAIENGLAPDHCVVLSATRTAAARMRSEVTTLVGGTSHEALARTPAALAFGILRVRAANAGLPTPRLLSGPEQDVVLKELLAGHAQGLGRAPKWPDDLGEALGTRGFRNELRDLLMRAVEWGCSPDQLRELARTHERPEWAAAADAYEEYDEVTALSRPGAFDPAWILGGAAEALQEDPQLLHRFQNQCRLVIVDDAQELTRAGVTFLATLLGPRQRLVMLGNPDGGVQGFRGSDARFMIELSDELARRLGDRGRAERFELQFGYRNPAAIDAVRRRVTSRIGAPGGTRFRDITTPDGGEATCAVLRSTAQEAAHIAGVLRAAHLLGNVAWKDMAIIVRGAAGTANMRRGLTAARVPVAVPPASLALHDEPAVRPFLDALDVVTASEGTIDVQMATDLLRSPLGGADSVALRRMRRALYRLDRAAHGTRHSDELLADAITDPHMALALGADGMPLQRVATVLQAGRNALDRAQQSGEKAQAETVLWHMWDASRLAPSWEAAALDGGVAGARADRDLDAILALFAAAAAYADRLPGSDPRDFVEHIQGQEVPGDRLVAAAGEDDAVALLTPAAAAGREWHTVVIAGVQDGVWPDLRLRGSVLGSQDLVDTLAGYGGSLRERQIAVRNDEYRQFVVALTRARSKLLVTAVRDTDEAPSALLDVAFPTDEVPRTFTPVARPMTLPAIVSQARRDALSTDPAVCEPAIKRLARLKENQVPGADPEGWWALLPLSDDRPLRAPQQPVRVSPSSIESFTECGLRWLLTTRGAGSSSAASEIGTLIHGLAADFGEKPSNELLTAFAERWPGLGFGEKWWAQADRARVLKMVSCLSGYLSSAKSEGWQQIGCEEKFEVNIGRAKLSGSADRLERNADGGVRVIDYKTTKRVPKDQGVEAHPQLAAYQLAVLHGAFGQRAGASAAGGGNAGAALVQLAERATFKLQEQPPLREADPASSQSAEGGELEAGSREWAEGLVRNAAEGMGADTFIARLNDGCQYCAVKSVCPLQPEGRSV